MTWQMKNSGISYFGDIPSHWQVVRNGYLFHNSKEIVMPNKDYQLLSLSTKGVREKDINEVGGKVPDNYNGYQIVHPRDMVMCLFDIDCSAVFSGLSNFYGMISPAYKILKCRSNILPEFAQYIFSYIGGKRLYKQYSKNLRYSLNIDDFMALKLIVPPINEQTAIADFLDNKCAEIDSLLEDLDKEVKNLAEYKKSIIAETVTHGMNPNVSMKQSGIPWAESIPSHWTIQKSKYHFELRRTKGNPHNLELMSPTQKYGVIPQSQLEGVVLVKEKTDLNTFRTIRPGDFCISLRSFQGGFEYSKYEGVVSPAYQVFYPIKPIIDGYFKYMFKSDGFISYINTFSMSLRDGKNIAFEDFGNSYIPNPPIDEQQSIASYLDEKCAAIEQALTDKQTQIETLKSYKSSLIYEYVTGKKQVI